MTDLTPNDLSHLSDEEFIALCPQGYHAPGPEPLSPVAQAVLDAVEPVYGWRWMVPLASLQRNSISRGNTMTQPNFRALCVELLAALETEGYTHWTINPGEDPLVKRARAELATPPPEPPTNEGIAAAIKKGADQEFYATVEALAEYCGCGVELTSGDAREVLYELRRPHIALDGWGNEKQ